MFINHCKWNNPVNERWYLNDGKKIIFSLCEICKKPLAVVIDSDNNFGNIISGIKRVEFLKKNKKRKLIYKDFEVKSQRNIGFVFGLNIEIHDCKGRINKIRQKAKDFFGNQNLVREIDL